MKSPKELAEIAYWLNEIDHKTFAEAVYLHASEALEFFGPGVAWRLDAFEMRKECMKKLNGGA